MAYRSVNNNTAAGTAASVPVPSGTVANDIVIISLGVDSNSATFTNPSGFTTLASQVCTADGHTCWIGYKRLTGTDAGSYTFGGFGLSLQYVCFAVAFSGRHTTNPPVPSTTAVQNTAAFQPTVTANGVTALAGDDLLWVALPDVTASGSGTSIATPTGYTEADDDGINWVYGSVSYKDNVSAGATGTVGAVFSMTSATAGYVSWLIRIPVASAATKAPPPFHRPAHFRRRT